MWPRTLKNDYTNYAKPFPRTAPHLAGLRDFGNMSFYLSTTESEHSDKLDVISIVTEELQNTRESISILLTNILKLHIYNKLNIPNILRCS